MKLKMIVVVDMALDLGTPYIRRYLNIGRCVARLDMSGQLACDVDIAESGQLGSELGLQLLRRFLADEAEDGLIEITACREFLHAKTQVVERQGEYSVFEVQMAIGQSVQSKSVAIYPQLA